MKVGIHTKPTDIPCPLLQLLSNTLILYQTAPYLSASSLLALGGTSKSFQCLIKTTPSVFRHLDLTEVKSAQFQIAAIDRGGEVWRNVQLDENVTEDESVPRCIPRTHPYTNGYGFTASTGDLSWEYSTLCGAKAYSETSKL